MYKICTKCNQEKTISCFSPGKNYADGYKTGCKECNNTWTRNWYDNNQEEIKQKYSYEKNKNQKLKRIFGISYDEYLNMLAAQNNCCAICGTDTPGARAFAVDHCHDTGKIRGLLCSKCNTGIGNLKDDIDLLKRAIQYLENSKDK
jgi:hypothetical protein